jgi:hypothetical protein
MIAMLLYTVLLGGLLVLLAASVSAFGAAIKQRARLRGILLTVVVALGSLLGIWALLV